MNGPFGPGDKAFIILSNKIHEVLIVEVHFIATLIDDLGSSKHIGYNIKYVIDENPVNLTHSKIFNDKDVFETKEDLIKTL